MDWRRVLLTAALLVGYVVAVGAVLALAAGVVWVMLTWPAEVLAAGLVVILIWIAYDTAGDLLDHRRP